MSQAISELHFIGVPFNCDGTPPGVGNPPQHLRKAELLERLGRSRRIHDCGDLSIPGAEGFRDEVTDVLNWRSWKAVSELFARKIEESLSTSDWPLVVGGDCSIHIGIMAGVAKTLDRCGLLFVDGHAAFLTPATSPTGWSRRVTASRRGHHRLRYSRK